jgi:hypothetical protein
MRTLKQIFIFAFVISLASSCTSQTTSKEGDIQKDISNAQPPEIPESMKKQDRIIKQIYRLEKEVRDLKIQLFINEVKQLCDIPNEFKEVEFLLEMTSGNLLEYKVNGSKLEMPCIEDCLIRINRNFSNMSYGFNNAFRMKPTRKFTISLNSNNKDK